MALDVLVGGANIDANGHIKTTLPATKAQAGFATMQVEIDDGMITGNRTLRRPFISIDDRLAVGVDSVSAMYNFTAGAQNTGDFKHAFTTMTMTQAAGLLNINPALATVSGNYAYLQSWKFFTLQADGQLHIEFVGQISGTVPPANQILELGLFQGTAGAVPADGAFFRMTSAGLQGVISYNGVETNTAVMIATLSANTNYKFELKISQREVFFWIDGVMGGKLQTPAGQAVPYLWLNLPIGMMMRNSGTVSGGITTKIGSVHVTQTDIASNRSWAEQMAAQGNAYQGQEGDAMGSLAIYSNAALGAAAALTNTTAAAPNVGLGGVVQVLPTLAAGTDGILFSYLNPVPTVTQPGKTLVVNGIYLDSAIQTILAGGPLVMVIGIAFGHTALSLATAETGSFVTATTKAPRRVPIGMQCYAATAAVGATAQAIQIMFSAPIVVNPGEYFAITCRNLGTVTTTGAVVFSAMIDHYFE